MVSNSIPLIVSLQHWGKECTFPYRFCASALWGKLCLSPFWLGFARKERKDKAKFLPPYFFYFFFLSINSDFAVASFVCTVIYFLLPSHFAPFSCCDKALVHEQSCAASVCFRCICVWKQIQFTCSHCLFWNSDQYASTDAPFSFISIIWVCGLFVVLCKAQFYCHILHCLKKKLAVRLLAKLTMNCKVSR